MSYTVFALRWRPKNFDEIIGQDHIVNQLKSATLKDRLAHAYLFSGPRGVGKTSTARILAKAINCKEGPTVTPCGKCGACLDIAGGRSMDVIEIDGASNRGIDDIRTLRENVKFSPSNGRFKIYIIDEVHQITSDGFNALLKTLEEPPEFVKFIFATTQPSKVPATILSRCQRLDFRRIPVTTIIAQLEKISGAEGASVDKDVLFAIARASDGALRDAESILDQLIAFSKGKVILQDVVSMLGMVEQNTLFELVDKMIAKEPAAALELLNGIIDNGKDAGMFLSDLIEHFRNLMVAKVSRQDSGLIDLPEDVCQRLFEQAERLSLEEIFNGFNVLVNTQETAKRLESLRIPLEISLVRLCLAKPALAIPVAAQKPAHRKISPAQDPPQTWRENPRLDPAPRQKEKPPVQPVSQPVAPKIEAPQPPPQQAPAEDLCPVAFEQVKSLWSEIIQNTSSQKISIGNYLKEGAPDKLQGNMLTILFHKNRSLYKESLEKLENRVMIEKILSETLEADLKVRFVLSEEEKIDDGVVNHPVLQSAMDTFNARLIKEETNG